MKNITDVRTLRSRAIARLMNEPQRTMPFCSQQGDSPSLCPAGLILQECGIPMEFDADGRAKSLPISVMPAHVQWLEYELKRARRGEHLAPRSERAPLSVAAKARETWAQAYGVDEAKFLPLYAHDWECPPADITQAMVVQRLQGLSVLFDRQGRVTETPRDGARHDVAKRNGKTPPGERPLTARKSLGVSRAMMFSPTRLQFVRHPFT